MGFEVCNEQCTVHFLRLHVRGHGYGLCFKAGEESWLPLREAGGGSSLELEGSKSLAAGEGG